MKDIVIDNNVMRLYDKPKDVIYKDLFKWIFLEGILSVSRNLINEYFRTQGECSKIAGLIDKLQREGRLIKVQNKDLNDFNIDRHYKYTCNYDDIFHARLVFLSYRKKLVTLDDRLIHDVNNFKKVDKIQPSATKRPGPGFYAE